MQNPQRLDENQGGAKAPTVLFVSNRHKSGNQSMSDLNNSAFSYLHSKTVVQALNKVKNSLNSHYNENKYTFDEIENPESLLKKLDTYSNLSNLKLILFYDALKSPAIDFAEKWAVRNMEYDCPMLAGFVHSTNGNSSTFRNSQLFQATWKKAILSFDFLLTHDGSIHDELQNFKFENNDLNKAPAKLSKVPFGTNILSEFALYNNSAHIFDPSKRTSPVKFQVGSNSSTEQREIVLCPLWIQSYSEASGYAKFLGFCKNMIESIKDEKGFEIEERNIKVVGIAPIVVEHNGDEITDNTALPSYHLKDGSEFYPKYSFSGMLEFCGDILKYKPHDSEEYRTFNPVPFICCFNNQADYSVAFARNCGLPVIAVNTEFYVDNLPLYNVLDNSSTNVINSWQIPFMSCYSAYQQIAGRVLWQLSLQQTMENRKKAYQYDEEYNLSTAFSKALQSCIKHSESHMVNSRNRPSK